MWHYSFEERRCLIPLTGWCEAEGEKGAKTLTWLRLPDLEVFAAAGIWRGSDGSEAERASGQWGDVYAMIMTDS